MLQDRAALGLLQQWVVFLRAMETRYAWEAAARGEPFTPLSADECRAAAELAAQFGLRPGETYGAACPIADAVVQPQPVGSR